MSPVRRGRGSRAGYPHATATADGAVMIINVHSRVFASIVIGFIVTVMALPLAAQTPTDGTVKGFQKISDLEGSFTDTLDNYDEFGVWGSGYTPDTAITTPR